MTYRDDDLTHFEAHCAPPLPSPRQWGQLPHDGASIWHARYGEGPPVVLPSVGHVVPLQQPDVFDAALLDFLNER
jgi:pimeloyl-ACP methyl ester carboxylesterase